MNKVLEHARLQATTSTKATGYAHVKQDPGIEIYNLGSHLLCSLCHFGQKLAHEHPNSAGQHHAFLRSIHYCI